MKKLALTAGLVLLLSGVAYAAIPDASGVIHGCYKLSNPAKGAVVVIDSEAGETCPSGTAPLNWNQTGPQGPAGPQGPTGPQGPEGPAGPALSPTITVVGIEETIPFDRNYWQSTVTCPTGTVAISGGYKLEDSNIPGEAKIVFATNSLTPGTTVYDPTFYTVGVQIDEPPFALQIKVQVYATCVDWSP
jgi:hypothetical protein